MPKRSRTKLRARKRGSQKRQNQRSARDVNQMARDLIKYTEELGASAGKNPLAVALGRLGGLKGGKARAEKLTMEQRRESARKAARARWDQEADMRIRTRMS